MNKYTQFDRFARNLVMSKDVDPIYPFIGKGLFKVDKYYRDEVDPVWFTFIYVLFYSLESAILFCNRFPTSKSFKESSFRKLRESTFTHFGIERRGKQRQVDTMVRAIMDVIIPMCDQSDNRYLPEISRLTNKDLRLLIAGKYNHGVWSAFKIAEVLEKAFGYNNLKINDLGLEGRDPNSNDGPVAGLRHLFGESRKWTQYDFEGWDKFGHELAKSYKFDIGEIETCFCKWHKIRNGKYYIGHDIDELYALKSVVGGSGYLHQMFENAGFPKQKIVLTKVEGMDGVLKGKKNKFVACEFLDFVELGNKVHSIDLEQIVKRYKKEYGWNQ
jgi:hypothetical protein